MASSQPPPDIADISPETSEEEPATAGTAETECEDAGASLSESPVPSEADEAEEKNKRLKELKAKWPGYSVFRLVVPVLKVGGIIGQKGDLIKKLVEQTPAKVRVLDAPLTSPDRIIKTDVETQGDFIRFLIKEVEGAAFTDIEDVLSFVKWLDDELSYLVDERVVLKHFEWPEKKADALREAAFGYSDLKKLESEAFSFRDPTHAQRLELNKCVIAGASMVLRKSLMLAEVLGLVKWFRL